MKKIILIGSGNVAYHLGHAFCNVGHQIVQVISKSETNAKVLAKKLNAGFETDINKIKQADFAIVGVNDDAISTVSNQIKNMPFAHTSGSVCLKNGGVFYPIQTLSKDIPLDLKKVPFCVSAKNKDFENTLFRLARSISNHVYQIDEKQRKILHLAAVFACNFSNNMYAIAQDLLKKSDLDFEILKPLIAETANKIRQHSPKSMQTGPAKRRDMQTIENHIDLLEDEGLKRLYRLITNDIQK